jgi:hypothetical protein
MNEVHLPRGGLAYSHALRVTLTFDGENIQVARVQRVAMRVPAPATEPPGEGTVGHWLAVEDAAGHVLYHFPLHDPTQRDREVFHDPKGGKPFRTPSSRTSVEFEVLVPDLPQGERFVLHGTTPRTQPEATFSHAVSVPLVTHTLSELRGLAASASRTKGGRP